MRIIENAKTKKRFGHTTPRNLSKRTKIHEKNITNVSIS